MATHVHAHALGEPYKRKEDARFIRGQGNYVDDVSLPGMLYGDIVRSPYGHALIKNVDISEALKVPGVLAESNCGRKSSCARSAVLGGM